MKVYGHIIYGSQDELKKIPVCRDCVCCPLSNCIFAYESDDAQDRAVYCLAPDMQTEDRITRYGM